MKALRMIALSCVFGLVAISISAGSVDKFQEIDYVKPHYIKRNADAWLKGGRIIGFIKNTTDGIVIEFYRSGKLVRTYKAPGPLNVYETPIIAPGIYNLVIKAPGFHDEKINKIRVKSGYDCVLDIVMGTRVFTNR